MDDDRIVHQEASALTSTGCEVKVFSAYDHHDTLPKREMQMEWLGEQLQRFRPEIVICDNPLSVKVARDSRKKLRNEESDKKEFKIIYDITEWYPSKKNLRNYSGLKKMVRFLSLHLLSFLSGFWSDAFLYGEFFKILPVRLFHPFKEKFKLPYYAPKNKVALYPCKASLKESCSFFYAGNLTMEKGFHFILAAIEVLAKEKPQIKFSLNIVTASEIEEWLQIKIDKGVLSNLKIDIKGWMTYDEFCQEVGAYDLYLDMRDCDIENKYCLPIKLFYYMAAGRPLLYSPLTAILVDVRDFTKFGCFIRPGDTDNFKDVVLKYINDDHLYQEHCKNAATLFQEKYNWDIYEPTFVKFINDLNKG